MEHTCAAAMSRPDAGPSEMADLNIFERTACASAPAHRKSRFPWGTLLKPVWETSRRSKLWLRICSWCRSIKTQERETIHFLFYA